MRVNKETLERWLDSINRRTGRPKAGYVRHEDGTLEAQIGHLFMDSNKPGDRRIYHVGEMHERGGVSWLATNEGMYRGELAWFVRGIMQGLDLARDAFEHLEREIRETEYTDTSEVWRVLSCLDDGQRGW